MKYYFISYFCERFSARRREYIFGEKLTEEHPIQWIVKAQKEFAENESYHLISWKEISEEEYLKFKDEF
jgi:hypothetical protein